MAELREVRLPVDLCRAAEEKFAGRFENIEALLEFVLREAVDDTVTQLDQAEERIVEERLRDLGYI
jgi:hypothetical protein